MPSLVAFGRKWGIGSDDFVFPGVIEIFFRIIWLIFLSVVAVLHWDTILQCNTGLDIEVYCIGMIIMMVIFILLKCITVFISSRGLIMNPRPRRQLVKILYVCLVLAIVEVSLNTFGTYWIFRPETHCDGNVEIFLKITVILFWLLAVLLFTVFLIVFGVLGGKKKKKKAAFYRGGEDALESAIDRWEKRLRKLLCCLKGDKNKNTDVFTDISKILAQYFQDVDLVPTDIAAGLILVSRDQEKDVSNLPSLSYDTFSKGTNRNTEQTDSTEIEDIKPKSWMTVEMMSHYSKYARASYGWPTYISANLYSGLCHLCKLLKCCDTGPSDNRIYYDNCCHCHTATIRKLTGLDKFDIVFADFHNDVFEIPFYVAVDQTKQSVVVAIRGTLSLQDAITDLSADSECMSVDDMENCMAHKGMLQAALYVKKTLEDKHILEEAFDKIEGKDLVLTGHSLGAGAAALLAILLKPSYPDLICFAYSPPGGLLSLEASKKLQETVCSVVMGKDLISRLSLWSMYDLKEKVLTAIGNSHSPKFRILASGIYNVLCSWSDEDTLSTERLIGQGSVANKELEGAIEHLNETLKELYKNQPPLYPPGQIFHILENDKSSGDSEKFNAEWTRAEDMVKEILLSTNLIADHYLDKTRMALELLCDRDFTPKQKESPEKNTENTRI